MKTNSDRYSEKRKKEFVHQLNLQIIRVNRKVVVLDARLGSMSHTTKRFSHHITVMKTFSRDFRRLRSYLLFTNNSQHLFNFIVLVVLL